MCEGDGSAGVGFEGGMVAVSARDKCGERCRWSV